MEINWWEWKPARLRENPEGTPSTKTSKTSKTHTESVLDVLDVFVGTPPPQNAEPVPARGPNHAAQLLKAHDLSPEGLERCLADLRQIRDIFYTSRRSEPIDPAKSLLPPLPTEIEAYYEIVRQLPMQVPARYSKEAKRRGLDPVTWDRFWQAARSAGHIVEEHPLEDHPEAKRYRLADAVTDDRGELLPGRWKQLLRAWQDQPKPSGGKWVN